MRRRQEDKQADYAMREQGISVGGASMLHGQREPESGVVLPPTHGGLTEAILAETTRMGVQAKARKLGIDVTFIEHVDPLPTGWARYQRIRSGDRITVIDSRVSPRTYEAALIAFATQAVPVAVVVPSAA